MVEPAQILLFAVVTTLTTLMVAIGWQIFQILSEIRKILTKCNTMVDTTAQNLNGFTQGIKAVLGIFKLFKKKEKDDE